MRGARYSAAHREAVAAGKASGPPRSRALVVLEDDPGELVRRGARQGVEVDGQRAAVVVRAQDGGGTEDGVALLSRSEGELDPRSGSRQPAAEIPDEHPALADVERTTVELLACALVRDHHGGR